MITTWAELGVINGRMVARPLDGGGAWVVSNDRGIPFGCTMVIIRYVPDDQFCTIVTPAVVRHMEAVAEVVPA